MKLCGETHIWAFGWIACRLAVCFSSSAISGLGSRVARIAAGDEDGVDPRQLLEDLAPLRQGEFDGGSGRSNRGPSPDTRSRRRGRNRRRSATCRPSFPAAAAGKCGLSASSSERGGISSIALRAEDGQVADVLLPLGDSPRRRRSWSWGDSRADGRGADTWGQWSR